MSTLIKAAAVAGVLASVCLVSAGGIRRSDSVVKVKTEVKPAEGGKATVVVRLDIQPGWHLYANPVGHEDFESGRVVLKVAGADAKITYPTGKEIDDPKIGKYKIYEKAVEILATVDRVPTSANPLEMTLRLQSCDDRNCLPPATVKLTAP